MGRERLRHFGLCVRARAVLGGRWAGRGAWRALVVVAERQHRAGRLAPLAAPSETVLPTCSTGLQQAKSLSRPRRQELLSPFQQDGESVQQAAGYPAGCTVRHWIPRRTLGVKKSVKLRFHTRDASAQYVVGTLVSPTASTHTVTDGSASATSAAALPPQCTASSKRERPLRSVCAKCTRPSGRLRAACKG